jgi:hypothetical protein
VELLEKAAERLLLGLPVLLVDVGRIRRVERDPQQDELAVDVVLPGQLLGAMINTAAVGGNATLLSLGES